MPITWCLATPKLGEREVAAVLLDDAARQQALAAGTIILADKGFAGAEFEAHVRDLHAHLLRPDRRGEPRRFGPLGGMRQWIESVFATCKGQFGLERNGARTLPGLCARVGLRLLALAAGLHHNAEIGEPGRSFAAYGA